MTGLIGFLCFAIVALLVAAVVMRDDKLYNATIGLLAKARTKVQAKRNEVR